MTRKQLRFLIILVAIIEIPLSVYMFIEGYKDGKAAKAKKQQEQHQTQTQKQGGK